MKIWVVEMWNYERERWEPTVGVGLTRDCARQEIVLWRGNNPSNRFRLKSYVPKAEQHDKEEQE